MKSGEAYDFMEWFCDLPYRHKIFISGNHDMCMYDADNIEGLPDNVHYLCNSSIVLDGIKFFGIPMFMEDVVDGNLDKMIGRIPKDTDILITHQPPYELCDMADYGSGPTHHGDRLLRRQVEHMNLKYHLFGHEHDANGVVKVGETVFSNACILDSQYQMIGKPRLFML